MKDMDNSVLTDSNDLLSSNLLPLFLRKTWRVYMILCLANDSRYYGKTGNLSGRIASHKSLLRRKIHANRKLQEDWDLFKANGFLFVVLDIDIDWKNRAARLTVESKS